MFDQEKNVLKMTIAITATRILDLLPFLFFNYNNIETCDIEYG